MDRALDDGVAALPAEFGAHLQSCAACRKMWTLLRAADTALREPRPVAPPAGMLAEFHRLVEADRRPAPELPRRRWWVLPAGALAGAGALAAWLFVAGPSLAPGGHAPAGSPMLALESAGGTASGPPVSATSEPARAPMSTAAAPPAAAAPATPRMAPARRDRPFRVARIDRPRARATVRREHEAAPESGVALVEGSTGLVDATAAALGRAGGVPAPAVPGDGSPARPVPAPLGSGGFGGIAGAAPAAGRDREEAGARRAVDFEVSPAVLSAMVRTVALAAEPASLKEVARELTLQADVPVVIQSGRAVDLRVTPVDGETQLWLALDALARQTNLEIVPSSDRVVLRDRLAREQRREAPGAPGVVLQRPSAAGARGPAGPVVSPLQSPRAPVRLQATPPDRTVWPDEWGTLPERGFVPPSTDEFLLFKVNEQQQNAIKPTVSLDGQSEKRSAGQPQTGPDANRDHRGGRGRR